MAANKAGSGNGLIKYAAAAVIIVAIIAVLSVIGAHATGSQSSSLVVQLTDPPVVPPGTQALIMTYSSVALHESGQSNQTGFVSVQTSGTVNLLNLTNVTQTIAVIKANANQSFDMVRFNISSASIVLDNVTYSVATPSRSVFARIYTQLNATNSSGVVVDLNPVVLQIYTSANQSVFVMVPAAKTVVIGKSVISVGAEHVGAREAIELEVAQKLRHNTNVDLTITNASLSSNGNSTSVSITVRNNAKTSIDLGQVMVRGIMEAIPGFAFAGVTGRINTEQQPYGLSSSYNAVLNASLNKSGNASASGSSSFDIRLNGSSEGSLNSTVQNGIESDLHVSVGHGSNEIQKEAAIAIDAAQIFSRNFHNSINFLVLQNGTLSLPFELPFAGCPAGNNATPCNPHGLGYELAAGASVKLTFSGQLNFGYTDVSEASALVNVTANSTSNQQVRVHLTGTGALGSTVVFIPNQTYGIRVAGIENRTGVAFATTNATAAGSINVSQPKFIEVSRVIEHLRSLQTGTLLNITSPGFLALANSSVRYTLYPLGLLGEDGHEMRVFGSYNLTNITVDTAGFTLANVTVAGNGVNYCPDFCRQDSPCIPCALPPLRAYVLDIIMPPHNYTGALSISADYTGANAIAAAT